MKRKNLTPLPREISEETMRCWLSTGAIVETDHGHENLYFQDKFGNEFFCKCYPNRDVREAAK